jgi:hypothetical protein
MAQRVKLKPDKPAPGPAIIFRRNKRGEEGPFLIGFVNEKGVEDWHSLEIHRDYDAALKAAESRAHGLRLPVRNATGIEVETKIERPVAKTVARPRQANSAPPQGSPSTKDLPPLSKQFRLPEIADERFAQLDAESIVQRATAMYFEDREGTLKLHDEAHGQTRDYACTYTQKTHDQIQGQLLGLFVHSLTIQAVLYAQLEAAFDRIAELERNALTVDSFEAQVAADDRTIELAFGSGENRQVASFKWPVPVHRGVYKASRQYEPGDMVTHEGSCWLAQRQTSAKPGTPDSGFLLAVKRGKDGKS